MNKRKVGRKTQPFPVRRPEIVIQPSRAKPFAVNCRELPSWFGVPEVGDCTLWSIYDPPDWRLTSVTAMCAVRPAHVHGLECVELEVDDWGPESGWQLATWMMFARVSEERVQWVANCRIVEGERRLYTFLDEGFDSDWGEMPRRLQDSGRLVHQEGACYELQKPATEEVHDTLGAGIFRVKIGARAFTCLRVLDIEGEPSEKGILYSSYITRKGRTVLGRRYNGRQWGRKPGWPYAEKPPWDERFPDHDRMVINGITYVHWYDCLSDLGCGVSQRRARPK